MWNDLMGLWNDLMSLPVPVGEKVLRTVAVYLLMLVLFRLSGKRSLANLNTFDFVVIFLLSNVVQNAIIGPDNSLLGAAIGAVTLVVTNAVLNRWLSADARAVRIFEGSPTTVIRGGQLLRGVLNRLALRPAEIEQAIRVQNGAGIEAVEEARIEPDGRLVIVLKDSEQGATRADIARLEAHLKELEVLLAVRVGQEPT